MIKGPILFITGAGTSVDSGLPTYRKNSGLYNNEQPKLTLDIWNQKP